jgi:hypothetical protein
MTEGLKFRVEAADDDVVVTLWNGLHGEILQG